MHTHKHTYMHAWLASDAWLARSGLIPLRWWLSSMALALRMAALCVSAFLCTATEWRILQSPALRASISHSCQHRHVPSESKVQDPAKI